MTDKPLMRRLDPSQRESYCDTLPSSLVQTELDEFEHIIQAHMLYVCAVLRGVVDHPPPWLADTPAVGYVMSVDPVRRDTALGSVAFDEVTNFTAGELLTFYV